MRSEWGSIGKRGDAWRIRWPKGYDAKTGKRLYGTKTIHGTKKDARLELDRIHADIEQADAQMTVSFFWTKHYLPEIEQHLAPSTVAGYRNIYRSKIEPVFGKHLLNEITGKEVQAWLDSMSYGAARHAKTAFSAMLGRAHAMDYVNENIMQRRYRLPGKETRVINVNKTTGDDSTLGKIAEAARGEVWEAVFLAAAFGGCRVSEAFGLKPEKISAIEHKGDIYAALLIDTTVQIVNRKISVRDKLKTEDSAGIESRWAIIAPPWANRILELASQAQEDGLAWMCDNGLGQPRNPDEVKRGYKRWFLDKEYPFIPLKNLRNSYTTNMRTKGVDLEDIAKLLGHTTDAITYKHYDLPDVGDLIERVSCVDGHK